MNEALNEAVHERFRFIEGILYWLQFIRFFRGPFNVQMLHIPALNASSLSNLIYVSPATNINTARALPPREFATEKLRNISIRQNARGVTSADGHLSKAQPQIVTTEVPLTSP